MSLYRSLALLAVLAFVPAGLVSAQEESEDCSFGDLDSILELLEDATADISTHSFVAVRAFTLNEDGEIVELDDPDVGSFDLGDFDIEGLEDLGADLQDVIDDLMEGFEDLDFEALGLGDIDLENLECGIDFEDFDFEDCDFDLEAFNLDDIDFEEMIENAESVMATMMVGPDGETIEWDGDLESFGLDLEDLQAHLEDALEQLDDLEPGELSLGGFGRGFVTSKNVQAFTVGADGELIEIDGDFDFDAFLEDVQELLEPEEEL